MRIGTLAEDLVLRHGVVGDYPLQDGLPLDSVERAWSMMIVIMVLSRRVRGCARPRYYCVRDIVLSVVWCVDDVD